MAAAKKGECTGRRRAGLTCDVPCKFESLRASDYAVGMTRIARVSAGNAIVYALVARETVILAEFAAAVGEPSASSSSAYPRSSNPDES